MRIQVVEDDTVLARFIKRSLESEHYAVDISVDGDQARAMATEWNFDLVVLDLNLPDGVAILTFLRTRKPSMPILVLTGRNRVEDRVQCLDLGADDCLCKPLFLRRTVGAHPCPDAAQSLAGGIGVGGG